MTAPFRVLLAACLLPIAASACDSAGESTAAWAGTVDTLATGTIVVSNPAEGIWDSASTWRIREELRIGSLDGEGPDMFGNIANVTVDAAGRIYVLESQAQEVRVFEADGTHLRTIGREGGGPGEFKQAAAVRMRPGGTEFWVVDYGNARYARFDTAGTYLDAVRRPFGFRTFPWSGAVDSAGHVLEQNIVYAVRDDPQRDVVIGFDSTGVPADTFDLPMYEPEVFVVNNERGLPMMTTTVPFTPMLMRYLDPRGFVWAGVNDRYRIVQRTLAGDTVRIIERTVEPREVTDADIETRLEGMESFEEQGGRVDRSRFGTTHGLFGPLWVDDAGYLWVHPDVPRDQAGRAFDIFDPVGRYLGRATSDVALTAWLRPVIHGDDLYAVVRDSLDVQYVIRARIDNRAATR